MHRHNYLFAEENLRGVFDYVKDEMRKAVQNFDEQGLRELGKDGVKVKMIKDFSIDAPVLKENEKTMDYEEIQVDVSHDQSRFISDRSQPALIDGVRYRFYIPFDGDPNLFKYRPSAFNLNPPIGKIDGQELVYECEMTTADKERAKTDFEAWLNSVRGNLQTVTNDTTIFNDELRSLIDQEIEARLSRIKEIKKVAEGFDIPLRSQNKSGDDLQI